MTRILAFTDPHGEATALEGILDLSRREAFDIAVCAGDISYFGDGYDSFVRGLNALGKPVYFVTGNHDTEAMVVDIAAQHPHMINIGDRQVEVAGVLLLGVPDRSAFWPGGKSDSAAVAQVVALGRSGDGTRPMVFVCHYPPWKSAICGMRQLTPDSGGSRTVRSIVETLSPAIMITGHYHQDFGREDRLGVTRLVNPGPKGAIYSI